MSPPQGERPADLRLKQAEFILDVLYQPTKRDALVKMTNWPTLPKVFIDGQSYGDTDILDPMAAKGEIEQLLKKAIGK